VVQKQLTKGTKMHALKRHHQDDHHGTKRALQSEDVARESWAMRHGAAFLAPGYAIVPELSSQGGSSAERLHAEPGEGRHQDRFVHEDGGSPGA
jgi:hypothetical protein